MPSAPSHSPPGGRVSLLATPRGVTGRRLLALAIVIGVGGCGDAGCGDAAPAEPDAGPIDPLGLHDWASSVVMGSGSRWVGERLPEHAPDLRPSASLRAESERFALSVHAPPGVPTDTAVRALRGAEAMFAMLDQEGWPAVLADGGRGGTAGFDLYLVETEHDGSGAPRRARFDARAPYTFLDRASTFARLSPPLADADLEICAGVAYAEALLLSADPAESESWRRATAAYLAHRLWGRWGCEDEALAVQQDTSEAFVPYADEPASAGGAVLLAALAERRDARTGEFVASLWDLASQRTWEGEGYRGSPDLWEALETVLRVSEDPLSTALETIAIDRFLAGSRRNERSPTWVRQLGPWAAPPAGWELSTHRLRTHLPSTGELDPPVEIEPTGSYYALVRVEQAPPQSRLRVFLRAEFGVAWSLAVARLDANGQELGRMSAPPRRGTPRSYLPVELGDDTAWVVIAITNLGREPIDARHFPVPNVDGLRSEAHGARLVLELVSDSRDAEHPDAEHPDAEHPSTQHPSTEDAVREGSP